MIAKISLLGICVCVISVLLRDWLKEAVLPLQLTFAVIVLSVILKSVRDVTDGLWEYMGESEIGSSVFTALFKGALICTVAKLASDAAKDSGNGLIADIIDLTGRIMLITIGFPFVENVIETAVSFLT